DWETARDLYRFGGPNSLAVNAPPGRQAETEARLRRLCRERGLLLQTNADFRAAIERAVEGARLTLGLLLVLVFLVSGLGVVNTLTANVLEQPRERGVLRAVGLKRGQLRKLIVCQALTLAAAGALPGLVVGLALAYLMNRLTPAFVGQVVAFHAWP